METIVLPEQAAAKREQLFIELYQKAFPAAARYISKMGGNFDEAKDVFQDALIIYYEKVIAGNNKPQTSEKAYLLGITKYLWVKRFKESSREMPLDDTNLHECLTDEQQSPDPSRLMAYLETAGKKCMELLRSFYYDQLSMTEIAGQFGFTGIRSATVQKYKCLEKVREQVKENALTYEDFLN